jgi:prepilin-type N-terminal cleavage/methylation domain-containing protein
MSLSRKGFTLIELIASLIVIGVLGSMLAVFLGESATKAGQPLIWLDSPLRLNAVMANVVADYRQNFTGDLQGLQLKLGDPVSSGYGDFMIAPNGNRFIKFVSGTAVDINGDPADPDYGKYLKVSIRPMDESRASETLTHLFTRQVE